MTRTLFVAKGDGGAAWYRCTLPALALGAPWIGTDNPRPDFGVCTGGGTHARGFEDLLDYDVVVLQQPDGVSWQRAIRRLQGAGVTVLYEIDDYVHGVAELRDHGNAHRFDKAKVRGFEMAMRAADGLIVSTEWLGEQYRAFNPNVWVCRNGLDLPRYALTRPAREGVAIGWAGGMGHLDAVRPWLASVAGVMRARPETRFVTVGQDHALQLTPEFGAARTTAIPFSPLETYPAAMTNFDVALAPAGKGGFFRGKSDLRWLEASALGIPLIADPDTYPGIEHGVTGFHAASPAEAREILDALVADAGLRERVGQAARAHVLEHRSVQAMAPAWATAIAEAAALRGACAA